MNTLVLPIDSAKATLTVVGGKGANLSRMSRTGFPVPPGFLITTEAYCAFEQGRIPPEIAAAVHNAYSELMQVTGSASPVAVRSSATSEDLPGASFAGQQESYLNVRGQSALLDAVKRSWSSLWTPRALDYRARQGIHPL